jgi:hypothetical protein
LGIKTFTPFGTVNTPKSNLAIAIGGTLVCLILSSRSLSKIDPAIIKRIAINVVHFVGRPATDHIKKDNMTKGPLLPPQNPLLLQYRYGLLRMHDPTIIKPIRFPILCPVLHTATPVSGS